MNRLLFGISFLSIGLLIKASFGHLARKWAIVETISMLLYLIGFTILVYKLITKSENRKGIEFNKNPLKWIFKRPFFVYVLIIPMFIGLIWTGKFLNEKLKNHYLSKEISETQATFIGFEEQSFLVKYSRKSEQFAILNYKTNIGIITQGLKKEDFEKQKKHFKSETKSGNKFPVIENLKNKKATIIYSLEYPSFFKIKE